MTRVMRWTGAVVAAAVAIALCVAVGQLAYEFFEIYGGDPQAGGWDTAMLINALPFVVVAALLLAGLVTAAAALAGQPRRRRRFLPVAGLSLVLTAAIAVTGAWLGTQAKQRGQERAAAACSADERQALQTLGTVVNDGVYGMGMTDGSCRGVVAFLADSQADSRLAQVRDTLTAQGWVPATAPGEPSTTYRKDGKDLEVIVVRDKAVEVTFSFV